MAMPPRKPSKIDTNTVTYLDKKLSAMKQERSTFDAHWRELADFIQPSRVRFFGNDTNSTRGVKKWGNVINSRATLAHRVAQSGMLAGVMSPARPWFELEVGNRDIMEDQPAKVWLHNAGQVVRRICNAGNLYEMAPLLIGDLLTFATGAMAHLDDFDDVARFYTFPPGSFYVAQDSKYRVDTLVREYNATVKELVEAFGWESCSLSVRTAWDNGNYFAWYPVVHVIEPNPNHDEAKALSKYKKFRSVYYQPGEKSYLSEAGFDRFIARCPRWSVAGEDAYGTDCPGMMALGDIKGLQVQERRKAQAIDKMVNPPLKGPPSLRNAPVSGLPGGLTIYEGDQSNKLEPIYQVMPPLQELRVDIDAVERRINEIFFTDLFLAITNIEGIQPRNQFDLIQRNEERLLQLGPVLERLHGEFLGPLIERIFDQALKARILPPPPPSLEGEELEIKFVSTLAMAQRSVGTSPIDRVAAFAGGLIGSGFEGVIDKFDADQALDEYAYAVGAPPKIIVSDDRVAEIRGQRQQMAQMQQGVEIGQGVANIAKMASDAKTGDENLLTDARRGASGG